MITPANWQPFIIQADTSVREAWSAAPVEYAEYTTEKTLGKASIWTDGWIGRMPKARLWSGPRMYQTPNPQTYQVVPQPFELSYTIDKFRYDDDGYGVFYPMLQDFALQVAHWPDYQMRDLARGERRVVLDDGPAGDGRLIVLQYRPQDQHLQHSDGVARDRHHVLQ